MGSEVHAGPADLHHNRSNREISNTDQKTRLNAYDQRQHTRLILFGKALTLEIKLIQTKDREPLDQT